MRSVDPHEVRNLLAKRLRSQGGSRAYARLSRIADDECGWMRTWLGIGAPRASTWPPPAERASSA